MCSHSYQHKLPYGVEAVDCPIPALFAKWEEAYPFLLKRGHQQLPKNISLIYDEDCCIFHSKRMAWKAGQRVLDQFFLLLQLLSYVNDQVPEGEHLDINLAEISLSDPSGGRLALEAVQMPRLRLYFNHSRFDLPLMLENCSGLLWDFSDCIFEEELELFEGQYQQVNFDSCVFKDQLSLEYTQFHDFIDMAYCEFHQGLSMTHVVFHRQFIFAQSRMINPDKIGTASISGIFKDFVDFSQSEFNIFLILSDCVFEGEVNFSNAIFRSRFFLQRPKIHKNFFIKGGDNTEELFQDLVDIDLESDFGEGKIIFENVSFMNIHETHRKHLLELSQQNKVIIGKGCIKYRLQSPDKTLMLTQDNQALIIEFVQTFANYFIQHLGMNLGLEIKQRTSSQITFFYFSDEDLSQDDFQAKLRLNEEEFLGLIFFDKSEFDQFYQQSPQQQDRLIQKIDGVAALWSVFLRVGIRIARGKWTDVDTENLLLSVNFHQKPLLNVRHLHQLLLKKFEQGNIIHQFLIQDKGVLRIEHQHIHGGNNQFAETIINQTENTTPVQRSSPTTSASFQQLKQQVAQGELQQVLDRLLEQANSKSIENDLINLKRRFREFEQAKHRDTMNLEEEDRTRNKIYQATLSLIDRVEEAEQTKKDGKR